MKRLLVTRDAERSEPLAEALVSVGIEVISLPLTRILPLKTTVPELNKVRWVVLTSVNGVRRFHECEKKWQATLPTDIRIAALGKVTIDAARGLLSFPVTVAKGRTGAELAAELLQVDPAPGIVLWPCAEKTIGELSKVLTEAGAEVIRWPLYQTQPLSAELIRHELALLPTPDAILFAAPSAVNTWAHSIEQPFERPCIAIGSTTEKALKQAGATNITTAETPDTIGMMHAVTTVLGSDATSLPSNESESNHA
ncbi:uroporphyrinogen-III synthase [bacterium]|nr:uroporphyrinogen-III synthase [bacterium]